MTLDFDATLVTAHSDKQDATPTQARREVARFIDAYNHTRRHSSCEMLPPVIYERVLVDRERARQDPASSKRAA